MLVTLGSGLAPVAEAFTDAVEVPISSLPGMATSTVPGHTGTLRIGELAGRTVVAQVGRVHLYEGHSGADVTRMVDVAARLGAHTFVVTNAAGGIDPAGLIRSVSPTVCGMHMGQAAGSMAREAFGGSGPAWEADNLLRHYNKVEPDFIRVDADEVTYPAHVILRYRLEKALIAGEMELEALPAEWNKGMQDLLGVTPPNDGLGCLQDIHWYDGAWGYFPTYTLGAMTAAQLFAAAREANPGIPEALGQGDFSPLMGWLAEHVHAQASSAGFEQILEKATGKPLDPKIFEAHLKARYLP